MKPRHLLKTIYSAGMGDGSLVRETASVKGGFVIVLKHSVTQFFVGFVFSLDSFFRWIRFFVGFVFSLVSLRKASGGSGMFHSLLAPPRIPAGIQVIFGILLATFCSMAVNGQARRGVDLEANNVGNGGIATITGRIFYPGGRPFDQRVAVRLQSINGEQMAFSNENGAFTFARLSAGTYSILLDAGKEYETARETVEVRGQRRNSIGSGEIVPVYINLKLKVTPVEKAGTVDANLAGVPEAALKLYKEARAAAQSGDRAKALDLLDEAIEKAPDFMMADYEKGVQYLQLNQPQRAIEPLETAIKLSPGA